MSYIDIIINTTGSSIKKNIKFTPSMVNDIISSKTIYFPPNFILDESNILKAVSDSTSIVEIMTNISMFTKLVNYNTKKRDFKKISINGEESKKIVEKNAEFMRKLWFVNNSKIIIDSREYVIVKSKINGVPRKRNPIDKLSIRFEMTVDVMISKDKSSEAILRLTCAEKRENINRLFTAVFGENLFDWSEDNVNRYFNTPAMIKRGQSAVTKKPSILTQKQKDYQKRQKIIDNFGSLFNKNPVTRQKTEKKVKNVTFNVTKGGRRSKKRRRSTTSKNVFPKPST